MLIRKCILDIALVCSTSNIVIENGVMNGMHHMFYLYAKISFVYYMTKMGKNLEFCLTSLL
jgi:hypothetical protein